MKAQQSKSCKQKFQEEQERSDMIYAKDYIQNKQQIHWAYQLSNFFKILGIIIFFCIILLIGFYNFNFYDWKLSFPLNQKLEDQFENKNTHIMQDKMFKKRNLSVWTKNCCPTTQTCGVFFQDCCETDERGCNWFLFCYEIADDQNCKRVKNIVKKLDGYWAV